MIVTLAKGQGAMSVVKFGFHFSIAPGEKKEVDPTTIMNLLDDGILVKAEYPEILNNQFAAIPFDGPVLEKLPKKRQFFRILEDPDGTN